MQIELFKVYELNENGRKLLNADKLVFIQIDLQTGYYVYVCNQLNDTSSRSGLMNTKHFNQIVK